MQRLSVHGYTETRPPLDPAVEQLRLFFVLRDHLPPRSTLFPYTTLFRPPTPPGPALRARVRGATPPRGVPEDRKSTRLNSSHITISYAVFCLKKKKE